MAGSSRAVGSKLIVDGLRKACPWPSTVLEMVLGRLQQAIQGYIHNEIVVIWGRVLEHCHPLFGLSSVSADICIIKYLN